MPKIEYCIIVIYFQTGTIIPSGGDGKGAVWWNLILRREMGSSLS